MPWASVFDNVWLPLRLAGVSRMIAEDRVRTMLRNVGLSEFADAYPAELSGGMKMRTSIARALVTQPSVLLMDEPFAALDEITRGRLNADLLAWWAARQLSVLFVTHSVYEAVFLSQRVLVMSPRPGRIVAEVASSSRIRATRRFERRRPISPRAARCRMRSRRRRRRPPRELAVVAGVEHRRACCSAGKRSCGSRRSRRTRCRRRRWWRRRCGRTFRRSRRAGGSRSRSRSVRWRSRARAASSSRRCSRCRGAWRRRSFRWRCCCRSRRSSRSHR